MTSHSQVKQVRIAIPIYGVTCWGSDALRLEAALESVAGVASAYVNAAMEMAYVQFDSSRCGIPECTAAIQRIGFQCGEASIRSLDLRNKAEL